MTKECVETHTITDRKQLIRVLGYPLSTPDDWYIAPVKPMWMSVYNGNSFNDKFEIGREYPVYYHESVFVIGCDGNGYKFNQSDWGELK